MDGETLNNIRSICSCLNVFDSSIFRLQLRPCRSYKDEYKECKSLRGRFQQYFVYGEYLTCDQWSEDYNNCQKWNWFENKDAAIEVIKSEMKRRDLRMQAHLDNTIWTKRDKPPDDWSSPLPDWMAERDKNTYLAIKAQEMRDEEEQEKAAQAANQNQSGIAANTKSEKNASITGSLCNIM